MATFQRARWGVGRRTRWAVEWKPGTPPLQFLLHLKPFARRLVVLFPGASPAIGGEPHFQRWSWSPAIRGSVLVVADPTLAMFPHLRIGWFIGQGDLGPLAALLDIVAVIEDRCELPPHRTLFCGSSAGGFAALQSGLLRAGVGRSIAINPQIDVLKYHDEHTMPLLGALNITRECAYAQPRFRGVFSLLERIRPATSWPAVLYVQNVHDEHHMRLHWRPFLDRVEGSGLPEGKEVTFLLRSNEQEKHGPPSKDWTIRQINHWT